MANFVPNEKCWIGYVPESDTTNYPAILAALDTPPAASVAAAIDLTCHTMSVNATTQGNTVPTPKLCSLFETTVAGTSQGQFQADFYRDDADTDTQGVDVAWESMERGTRGVFIISRYGGSGTHAATGNDTMPIATEKCEVWPVEITTRAAGALTSNTVQTFQVTAAINIVPAEAAVVAA